MSARRFAVVVVAAVLVVVLIALLGCSAEAEDATFLGYKQRPTDENPEGLAIIQLASGAPAEASCRYTTLENGVPVKVVPNGSSYKIVAVSPDWTTP